MAPILSIRNLASRIGVSPARLRKVADDVASHYRQIPLRTGPDKVRILRIPDAELMDIQRRIKKWVLDPIALSKDVHGGVRGRSPRSNAMQHVGQPCIVTLDVRKFFDKVRHTVVHQMFRNEFGFGRDVAYLLTRLTTLDSRLPQGAPTSTVVANLLLTKPVDGPLSEQAARVGIRYTRFVDDLAFSGSNPRQLMNTAARLLSQCRLQIYRKNTKRPTASKLKIRPRSTAQEITGLLVNSAKGPSVSRVRRDRIRAAIYNLSLLNNKSLVDVDVRSIIGKITYVRQFNPGAASRLKRYLSVALQVDSGGSVKVGNNKAVYSTRETP